MVYFGSAQTGNGPLGLPNADLGQVLFQNTSNAVISTNGPAELRLGTNNVTRVTISSPASGLASISVAGALNVNGSATAGLTVNNGPISTTGGTNIETSGQFVAGGTKVADSQGCYYA